MNDTIFVKKFYIGLRIYLKKLRVILSRGSGAGNYLFFEIFDLVVDFYGRCQRIRRNEICIFIFVGFFDFSVTWSE